MEEGPNFVIGFARSHSILPLMDQLSIEIVNKRSRFQIMDLHTPNNHMGQAWRLSEDDQKCSILFTKLDRHTSSYIIETYDRKSTPFHLRPIAHKSIQVSNIYIQVYLESYR